ncbi:MAG: hypothetical protein FWK04_18115 [Nostoc sp. GBBB01]|nr:hypothetical protein [Nostoc sp. GBBB01]
MPGDTTQLPGDATQLPGDTTQLPGDTTQLPGDATQLRGDTTQLRGDTTQLHGSSYLFIKTLGKQYAISDLFATCSQYRNNLYQVLKILKHLGQIIAYR